MAIRVPCRHLHSSDDVKRTWVPRSCIYDGRYEDRRTWTCCSLSIYFFCFVFAHRLRTAPLCRSLCPPSVESSTSPSTSCNGSYPPSLSAPYVSITFSSFPPFPIGKGKGDDRQGDVHCYYVSSGMPSSLLWPRCRSLRPKAYISGWHRSSRGLWSRLRLRAGYVLDSRSPPRLLSLFQIDIK